MSFSASAKVVSETGGPLAALVLNAGGAPGGKFDVACASRTGAVPSANSKEAAASRKALRDFVMRASSLFGCELHV
jgi:hypothetical protein